MYQITGCLGTIIATVDTTEEAVHSVLSQVPLGHKKTTAMRNALPKLQQGKCYHVEYAGTGCTILRL